MGPLCALLLAFFGLTLLNTVEPRQMCLSCQYVQNAALLGIQCAGDPWNWRWGNNRMRCPHRCLTDAQFDLESGQPLFVYRGCTKERGEGEGEGCVVGEGREFCRWGCEWGDYCNNLTLTTSPSKHAAIGASTDHRHLHLDLPRQRTTHRGDLRAAVGTGTDDKMTSGRSCVLCDGVCHSPRTPRCPH
ncbi:hypothetical protein ACOMHN_013937 [Nucella lapillus]